MLDHNKKLEFVHKMAKLGLQHFDSGGGVISAGNSNPLSGIAGAFTAQNGFQAGAPTSAGTVGSQQATLAGQLQNEAAGNGPNPAQIQYKQNAQQIAQSAATTNSQNRALNPGLAARLSGNQAVAAGQVSAGTAAAQQAEQQLAAQQQMEGLTGQEQTGALSAQAINAQTAQNNANSVNQTQGGILSSLPFVGGLFKAHGGEVGGPVKMAVGGSIQSGYAPNFSNADVLKEQEQQKSQKPQSPGGGSSPISGVGQFLNSQPTSANNFGAGDFFSGSAPALGSSEGVGGAAAAPSLMDAAAVAAYRGGKIDPRLASKGGSVKTTGPNQQPVSKSDNLKNDRVPALLTKGETVIDLDTLKRKDDLGKAARFVAAALAKRKMGTK